MTAMNAKHQGQERTMLRRWMGVATAVLFAAALPAHAENVLQDVSFSASADGGVDVTLQLAGPAGDRSEEHTSELQSPCEISYAVFCLKKKK